MTSRSIFAALRRTDSSSSCEIVAVTCAPFKPALLGTAAPGVDALRVVADDRDVVMPRGNQIYQIALQLVRVLILVHKDELKTPLIMFADVRVFLQQLEPEREQVVEVHAVGRAFAGNIFFLQIGNLLCEL